MDSSGKITTIAGTGKAGDNGDGGWALEAELKLPYGVAVDSNGENIYIADTYNHRIRKVDSLMKITTIAGTGESGFDEDDDLAIDAKLKHPGGVAVDSDGKNIYIADTVNHRIRKVE